MNPNSGTTLRQEGCFQPIPFPANDALTGDAAKDINLPTTIQNDDTFDAPAADLATFLASDLLTPRLDCLYNHLWLAGLMRPARPLHRQLLLGRRILITEGSDEHLLWHESSIFIKPLPEYLLSHDFWTTQICPAEPSLYSSALGLMWSYTWLIRTTSDLRIAHEKGLLPIAINWDSWSRLANDVIQTHKSIKDHAKKAQDLSPSDMKEFHPSRYDYGELRLSRLNKLYRLGFAGWSARHLVSGFSTGSEHYTTFFERNFGWLLAVFVYLSVILSALQVALATSELGGNDKFQALSYGIALASLGMVLFSIVLAWMVWAGLFWFHLLSTIWYNRRVKMRR